MKNPSNRPMPPSRIRPVGDRVLVRYIVEPEPPRGGVIIPDIAKEKPQRATVIALGTGAKKKNGRMVAFEVVVGDEVLLGNFAGADVTLDGQKLTLVREEEILGRIG